MKVIKKIASMQKEIERLRIHGKKIGFVPTMGYLHDGHLSLIREARKKSNIVVLSIFVNPTQFGLGEDFNKYPRNEKHDFMLAKKEKVDYLFYPDVKEMYPVDDFQTSVINRGISLKLESEFRPTHFDGVTTVVSKLFNIVKPHIAVFGEKDYQQSCVIKQMVEDLNFDVKIIVAPIVRDTDGLALSSRNMYLSKAEREDALVLNQALIFADPIFQSGESNCYKIINKIKNFISKKKLASIDYVRAVDPDTLNDVTRLKKKMSVMVLLAVRIGKTRLIDNRRYFVK
jgi:pantoate--beta-alanine ligase